MHVSSYSIINRCCCYCCCNRVAVWYTYIWVIFKRNQFSNMALCSASQFGRFQWWNETFLLIYGLFQTLSLSYVLEFIALNCWRWWFLWKVDTSLTRFHFYGRHITPSTDSIFPRDFIVSNALVFWFIYILQWNVY